MKIGWKELKETSEKGKVINPENKENQYQSKNFCKNVTIK